MSVSIRTNNPGAMWGGKRAEKWGATDDLILNDGQKNHIAVFPTKVQGAAAQFDLWRSNYCGITLQSAINKWSGGNSSPAYAAFLKKNAGVDPLDLITSNFLSGPRGISLLKAQAQWEAGEPYPMTDAEWRKAQNMVFYPVLNEPDNEPNLGPTQPAPSFATAFAKLFAFILSLFKRK